MAAGRCSLSALQPWLSRAELGCTLVCVWEEDKIPWATKRVKASRAGASLGLWNFGFTFRNAESGGSRVVIAIFVCLSLNSLHLPSQSAPFCRSRGAAVHSLLYPHTEIPSSQHLTGELSCFLIICETRHCFFLFCRGNTFSTWSR